MKNVYWQIVLVLSMLVVGGIMMMTQHSNVLPPSAGRPVLSGFQPFEPNETFTYYSGVQDFLSSISEGGPIPTGRPSIIGTKPPASGHITVIRQRDGAEFRNIFMKEFRPLQAGTKLTHLTVNGQVRVDKIGPPPKGPVVVLGSPK